MPDELNVSYADARLAVDAVIAAAGDGVVAVAVTDPAPRAPERSETRLP